MLGRSPREGHSNPLQYSCLGNHVDRGSWWAPVHAAAELNTPEQLWLHFSLNSCCSRDSHMSRVSYMHYFMSSFWKFWKDRYCYLCFTPEKFGTQVKCLAECSKSDWKPDLKKSKIYGLFCIRCCFTKPVYILSSWGPILLGDGSHLSMYLCNIGNVKLTGSATK